MPRRNLRDIPTDTIVGKTFGRLTIVKEAPPRVKPGFMRFFWATCECGFRSICTQLNSLLDGKTTSCGCNKANNIKHGQGGSKGTRTKLYSRWASIKDRCHNPKNPQYNLYGGRGIQLYTLWYDFIEFNDYCLKNLPDVLILIEAGYHFDRTNNDSNYEPGNIRLVTPKQNAGNTRRCYKVQITPNCPILNLKEAVDRYSVINYGDVRKRIKKGWPIIAAILLPDTHNLSLFGKESINLKEILCKGGV